MERIQQKNKKKIKKAKKSKTKDVKDVNMNPSISKAVNTWFKTYQDNVVARLAESQEAALLAVQPVVTL